MKITSAKQKGKLLEKLLRSKLLEAFPELDSEDIRVTVGQERGSDLKLTRMAQRRLPFKFECKNRATFVGYSWYQQCCNHEGDLVPIVVIKQNRCEPLVLFSLDHFLTLINN